jgi:predicted Holliday junction resolvase-like endonuclease
MKLVKAIAAIGIILLLIVFFIHLVNEFLAVKSAEKTIQNLPKIEQKLKKAAEEKEKQLKQTDGNEDEEKKEDQE